MDNNLLVQGEFIESNLSDQSQKDIKKFVRSQQTFTWDKHDTLYEVTGQVAIVPPEVEMEKYLIYPGYVMYTYKNANSASSNSTYTGTGTFDKEFKKCKVMKQQQLYMVV